MKVATSIAIGHQASPELVTEAVAQAMDKAGISIANSVLLFLTSEFASDPQPAIRAAATAASCTQIMGCSTTGIFTEDDWVLDAPAAAVMVFGDDIYLQTAKPNDQTHPLFTLTAPNAINSTWLNNGYVRFGGVSGDAIGQGPFSVWQNAKGHVTGYVEAFFEGAKVVSKASHGLQLLTTPSKVQKTQGYDVMQIDGQAPLNALTKAWKAHGKTDSPLPLHLIMAVYADSTDAIYNGNYNQTNLISLDEANGSITLAHTLASGQFICWGIRDPIVAEADLTIVCDQVLQELDTTPDFGLLFSCLGRGPYFYGGIDRDLNVLKDQFPHMPLLGFYGNGEIAPISDKNQLLPYSAVLSLFASTSKS